MIINNNIFKKHLKLHITNTCGTDVCVEEHDHSLPCNATALFPKEANLVTLWHKES